MSPMEPPVRAQYNRMAARYDRRWRGYLDATLGTLQAWVRPVRGLAVLDVACGTGELARRMGPDQAQQLVGVDLTPGMLSVAAQKLTARPEALLAQAGASSLPFASSSFDLVVTASAFHYFPAPVAALREMARVVRPGGRVVVLDWCRDFWLCQLCDIVLRRLDPAHRACYTQRELHACFAQAGLHVVAAQRLRVQRIWGIMVATGVPSGAVLVPPLARCCSCCLGLRS